MQPDTSDILKWRESVTEAQHGIKFSKRTKTKIIIVVQRNVINEIKVYKALFIVLFYVSFGYGNGFANFKNFLLTTNKKVLYRHGMTTS